MRRHGAVALTFAYICIALAVLLLRPKATFGPFMRDFEAYWSAGATWNAGTDPYGIAIWNAERTVPGVDPRRDEVLPFVGPPASLPVLWGPLGRLPYAVAASVWYATILASLLGVLILVSHAARRSAGWFLTLALLAFAVSFGPVTSDLALGQIALVSLFGAVAALALSSNTIASSVAAFVALMQPNVAVMLVARLGRNRTTLALLVGGAGAYLAGVFATGWAWPLGYARIVVAHASGERFAAIQLSPASIAYGFGLPETASIALAYAIAAIAVAAAIWICFRVRDPFVRFISIGAVVPFVAGFFHEHDLVVAFPAALWCALQTRGRLRTFALASTMLVAVDWIGMAQRATGVAQSALLALTALATFVALGEADEIPAALGVGAGAGMLFAVATWLSLQHPAAIWPDAMGAFHAAPGTPIAQIWHDEQQASGLMQRQPAWSLLRSLSLIGSAGLAVATSFQPQCYHRETLS